ncbi:membrane protease YdiL (CAAX protease family) [Spinactinospora alkalitolerans]|uniref:Membrane protease YdiL (CAAX protease family) n=1 Tax=Spinactinospora alkalitolerans TaxID=687207 RepID=A0A852TSL0_9ACTN|nr:CPBP family intramembrane glutamic endopeptidase [Spinactinospora alkalitolerans]NYE45723.1 membrane protease YdiL (CAAX protease family) [Spinactinospora alkalitolerans]
MARTARFRWWTPLLAVVAAIALYLLVQIPLGLTAKLIAIFSGAPLETEAFFDSPIPDLAVDLVILAMMIPVAMFIARFVQWRRIGTLASVEGRMRWSWLLVCVGVAVVAVAVSFEYLFAVFGVTEPGQPTLGPWVGAREFALGMLVIVLLVPFQASAEEYALRGFLMQAVGSYGAAPHERAARRGAEPGREPGGIGRPVSAFLRTPVLAILISGGVFAALHDYSAWALADVACFGLAMAWLTWYTGGLEAAVALHVLHNIAAFGISAYEGTLDQQGGAGSWQGLTATVLEVGLFCLVVAWLAGRRNLRRRTAAGDPAGPPAEPAAPRAPELPDRAMRSSSFQGNPPHPPDGYSGRA